ncbi:resolvase-like protein [Paenibacillus sp. J31TS4]|uniref:recombinase family protein n=1 Tax=Paenibacillus sp. J31TS4 TaxID=2807195 RepID=UPI001B285302|nr:recombinase family protein [Paenibacillus sp. J31TS4]GIP37325.1 resolvase-like protein [Paenibacillus sp. J31TS4]
MTACVTAYLYLRVSTEEQAEKGYSLEAQFSDCWRKAMELGCRPEDVTAIRDEASGASLDRPGLARLRDEVAAEKPGFVIVYDPDRLARKLSHQLLLTDELLRHGVQLEFVNFEWKNTAEGRLFYQLRGMFAEFEREKIRERTMRGRYTKTKQYGKLNGDPRLYGYRFDTEHDRIVPEPVEGQTVRLMFQLAADGWSGERIARELQAKGIPAPRGSSWYGATVTRILRNDSYLGTYRAYKVDYHQGFRRRRPPEEQIPLPIEPLVGQELYEQAQRTLDRNRTRTGRPAARSYLLAGLGVCACGQPMRAGSQGGSKRYGYYSCPDREDCASRYWNSDAVDEAVWPSVRAFAARLLAESRDGWGMAANEEAGDGMPGVQSAWWMRQREELAAKRARLVELFVDGRLAKEPFDRKLEELEADLNRLRSRLAQATAGEPETAREELPSDEEGLLDRLDAAERRELARLLLREARFGPGRRLLLIWNVRDEAGKPYDSQGDGRP